MPQKLYTPSQSAQIELRAGNSRFIGIGEPFREPLETKGRIERIRTAHPGCSHVAYAFAAGEGSFVQFGQSDDGEPRGTAGRPMLEVLKGYGVSNVLIAAVRYFGGTKLGTGGLVRAYGDTAKHVLGELPLVPLEETASLRIRVSYEFHDTIRHLANHFEATVEDEGFDTDVTMLLKVPERRRYELERGITDATRGRVKLIRLE